MLRLMIIFWCLWVAVSPSAADVRIDRTKTVEVLGPAGDVKESKEWTDVLLFSADGLRWDRSSASAIVRAGTDTYLYIDHKANAYVELPLPLVLEDLLTAKELECLQGGAPLALTNLDAEVTVTEETRVFGRWKTTKLHVAGQHPTGLKMEEESWITHDLPVDLDLYFKMMLNKAALSPVSRAWYGEMVAAGGFPVNTTTIRKVRGHERRMNRRLNSVREVESDPDRYRPPKGYTPTLKRPPLDVACAEP